MRLCCRVEGDVGPCWKILVGATACADRRSVGHHMVRCDVIAIYRITDQVHISDLSSSF